MKAFSAFIPTARAAKRFMNVYRLIRAMVPAKDRAAFIGTEQGGEHRAVLMMLAILTGNPEQAVLVLQKLGVVDPNQDWWTFAKGFELGPAASAQETRVFVPEGTSCRDFVRWAATVGRYAFAGAG